MMSGNSVRTKRRVVSTSNSCSGVRARSSTATPYLWRRLGRKARRRRGPEEIRTVPPHNWQPGAQTVDLRGQFRRQQRLAQVLVVEVEESLRLPDLLHRQRARSCLLCQLLEDLVVDEAREKRLLLDSPPVSVDGIGGYYGGPEERVGPTVEIEQHPQAEVNEHKNRKGVGNRAYRAVDDPQRRDAPPEGNQRSGQESQRGREHDDHQDGKTCSQPPDRREGVDSAVEVDGYVDCDQESALGDERADKATRQPDIHADQQGQDYDQVGAHAPLAPLGQLASRLGGGGDDQEAGVDHGDACGLAGVEQFVMADPGQTGDRSHHQGGRQDKDVAQGQVLWLAGSPGSVGRVPGSTGEYDRAHDVAGGRNDDGDDVTDLV